MPRFAHLVLSCLATLLLLFAPPASAAQADPTPIRVLFVGNSLTYANNLPRMVRAIAASQPGGPAIETATYAIPGAELDDLWDDGHAAAALREGRWDVVVLQERGGLLSCIVRSTRDPECRRSDAAHRRFTELAGGAGARVLLLMTWPPSRGNDLGDARQLRNRAERLTDAYGRVATRLGSGDIRVAVVPAAAALYRFAAGRAPEEVLADGIHPSVAASLIMAAQLYAAIAGTPPHPADLLLDFPLLPANAMVLPDSPLESQPQIAGDGSRVVLKAGAVAPFYAAAGG
jgi:hypothetical protein